MGETSGGNHRRTDDDTACLYTTFHRQRSEASFTSEADAAFCLQFISIICGVLVFHCLLVPSVSNIPDDLLCSPSSSPSCLHFERSRLPSCNGWPNTQHCGTEGGISRIERMEQSAGTCDMTQQIGKEHLRLLVHVIESERARHASSASPYIS